MHAAHTAYTQSTVLNPQFAFLNVRCNANHVLDAIVVVIVVVVIVIFVIVVVALKRAARTVQISECK